MDGSRNKFGLHDSMSHHITRTARLVDRRVDSGLRVLGLTRIGWCILLAVEVEDDEDAAAFVAGVETLPSTPIYGASRVEGDWVRGRLSMETDALVAFVDAVRTLEGLD